MAPPGDSSAGGGVGGSGGMVRRWKENMCCVEPMLTLAVEHVLNLLLKPVVETTVAKIC